MGKNLKPFWGGIVTVIAYLYALLVTSKLFANEPDATHGIGLIMTYIMAPLVFLLVWGLVSAVLTGLFGWIKDEKTRSLIALPAVGVFLVMYGLPSLLIIFFTIIFYLFGYFYSTKLQTDEHDLRKFMEK
jgi:chromate transport protein ChrA